MAATPAESGRGRARKRLRLHRESHSPPPPACPYICWEIPKLMALRTSSLGGLVGQDGAGESFGTQRRMLAPERPVGMDSVKVDVLVKASWPQGA